MIYDFESAETGIGVFDFGGVIIAVGPSLPIRGCVHIADYATTIMVACDRARTEIGANDVALTTVGGSDEAC